MFLQCTILTDFNFLAVENCLEGVGRRGVREIEKGFWLGISTEEGG